MASVWDKIDSGLASIYANFLRVRELGAANVASVDPVVAEGLKLHVSLRYTGNLASVEEAGFETVWTDGQGQATGSIRLEDLQEIASQDEVITIRVGTPPQLHLQVSVPQINANKVWTQGAGGAFSGKTGAGILVGIIDTGIDINHKFLWRQTIPENKTRILRIWDMGLKKIGAEKTPERALLHPGTPLDTGDLTGSYGVEYKEEDINKVIQGVAGAMKIRHKDCSGHGTHVASTAAGDGRFKFKFVGVAPRAELIIVKIFYLENEPFVGATKVSYDQMFKDAVTYIRKVANSLTRPVAINYSIGNQMGPHDGLTETEDWLANEFRDAASPGKIFITSAGNSADSRQHAQLDFTTAGQVIDVPFKLTEDRSDFKDLGSCKPMDNTKALNIHFYYPNVGATVAFELMPAGEFVFTSGPVLGAALPTGGSFSGRDFSWTHSVDTDALISGVVIKRNLFEIELRANPVVKTHKKGTYIVRVKASAPVTVHVWCYQPSWDQKIEVGPDPLPAGISGVTPNEEFLVGDPGSASNVITVAAYNPQTPLDVASFSSRGPLARHGVGGVAPQKPDIGAPGIGIQAARSTQTQPLVLPVLELRSLDGTSMAAPHVTGTVALMLQNDATLTGTGAIAKLQANALKSPAPVAEEIGGGRLDAKKAFDNTP